MSNKYLKNKCPKKKHLKATQKDKNLHFLYKLLGLKHLTYVEYSSTEWDWIALVGLILHDSFVYDLALRI